MRRFVLGLVVYGAIAALHVSAAGASSGEASLELRGPSDPVIADWPFDVTAVWHTDGPLRLSVELLQAPDCGENLRAGLALDPYGVSVAQAAVVGSGERVDAVTIAMTGSYFVCGYLERDADPGAPAGSCGRHRSA